MLRDVLWVLAFFPLWGLCGVALLELSGFAERFGIRLPMEAAAIGGAILAALLLFALERLLGFLL